MGLRSYTPLLLLNFLTIAASDTSAQRPSPMLLVLARTEAKLIFADPITGKILKQLPTSKTLPHELITSTDGKLAFVSAPDDDVIVIYDVREQKELRRLSIGKGSELHGMLFAADKLYFTAQGFKMIGRYNPATDHYDWFLGTGQNRTHMLVMTKDINTIFVTNVESDSVTAIDGVLKGPPGWKAAVIPVGKAPEGITISPDDREVWTATWGDNGISIIDVGSRKVIQTLKTDTKEVRRLQFTPDGKQVLVADARGDLLVFDAATRKPIKRLKPGNRPPGVVEITPDGKHALLGVEDVAVLDLKTLEITSHIPTGSARAIAWVDAMNLKAGL